MLLAAGAAAASPAFPQPPELQPDVDFWLSIFTEVPSTEGVLHDNRNLGVVYGRVAVPAELSRRERNRRIANRRRELQTVLRTLAAGKRDNLSDEEARVLAGDESLFQAIGHLVDRNRDTSFFSEHPQQLAVTAEDAKGDLHLHVVQGFDIRQVGFEDQVGDADGGDAED